MEAGVAGNVLMIFFINRVGKRLLALSTMATCSICYLSIGFVRRVWPSSPLSSWTKIVLFLVSTFFSSILASSRPYYYKRVCHAGLLLLRLYRQCPWIFWHIYNGVIIILIFFFKITSLWKITCVLRGGGGLNHIICDQYWRTHSIIMTIIMIGQRLASTARAHVSTCWFLTTPVFLVVSYRSKNVGRISSATYFNSSFLMIKFNLDLEAMVGFYNTFVLFGTLGLVGQTYMYFQLPETENKTLNEISERYKNKSAKTKTQSC